MKEGCSMGGMTGGHGGHDASRAATESATVKPVFKEPVQFVFDNYMKVQAALAQDSTEGLAGAGSAMAKAVQ